MSPRVHNGYKRWYGLRTSWWESAGESKRGTRAESLQRNRPNAAPPPELVQVEGREVVDVSHMHGPGFHPSSGTDGQRSPFCTVKVPSTELIRHISEFDSLLPVLTTNTVVWWNPSMHSPYLLSFNTYLGQYFPRPPSLWVKTDGLCLHTHQGGANVHRQE